MEPLIIHHVIRHRLSRIETNNFQDKRGCSINGIRSILFEEGIVEDLDGIEIIIRDYFTIKDYRGFPIELGIDNFKDFPLSDEILRMKNVGFYFDQTSKPIHKLVSPEPHFVGEERNLIENHFNYLGSSYEVDDVEEWDCFKMDCEGHLVSLHSNFQTNFQLSNESIEHLSNFSHLRNLDIYSSTTIKESLINLSILSNLKNLSINCVREYEDPELLKDLGLFSNLLSLNLSSNNGFENYKFDIFSFLYYIFCILLGFIILPPSFSNLSNLSPLGLSDFTFQGFERILFSF